MIRGLSVSLEGFISKTQLSEGGVFKNVGVFQV